VSRRDAVWLRDILTAIDAIEAYLDEGDLGQGIVYDACRLRLIEIGEAVKGVDPDLLASEAAVPWRSIARMRDHLTHRYFDTDHAVVQDVIDNELGPLRTVVGLLLDRLEEASPGDAAE
jgi:uncharacterized protein with HEPN domain